MPITAETAIAASTAPGQDVVRTALRRAGEATGAGFELLYNIARRESSLNPTAEAKTSSAAGLFQFIDQTWLAAVKNYGAKHGLQSAAADITVGENGRYTVADPLRRKEILDLRFDPSKAAGLAGELLQENRVGLERRLGRAVNQGELYAAHFLGVGGAAKVLAASPDAKAADIVPTAAAANRQVFFGVAGAKSVAEVIASFEASIGAGATKAAASPNAVSNTPPPSRVALFASEAGADAAAAIQEAPIRRASLSPRARAEQSAPRDFEPASPERQRLYELIGAKPYSASLSPLAIAVLQSLDPTELGKLSRDPADRA